MSNPYTIETHQHRLAAWAAARAASASPVCRFSVENSVSILDAAGFDAGFSAPEMLPEPDCCDRTHREWRKAVIAAAAKQDLLFTHGIAAKLINVYLKVRFVCGGHHKHARVKCLHPPIDALLLTQLAAENFGGHASQWRKFRNKRWSRYDSETYQNVIDLIRQSLPNQPLWKIEEHWAGHQ
jgi:hypothetical protein